MDMRPPPYSEFRFAFHARDFEASVRFYQEHLGLLLTFEWDRPTGRGALLNAAFGATVEIYGAARGQKLKESAKNYDYSAINLAVRVASPAAVDETHARLQSIGLQPESAPADRPWGQRGFVVRDPDGIAVDVYAELAPPAADPPGLIR